MRNLLFYEPEYTGHHYPYLARMIPGFVHPEINIVLATTPEGAASDHYQRFLAPLAEHFTLVTDCQRLGDTPYKIAANRLKEIKRLQQRHQSDHVFVAYADGVWQVQAVRSLLPWESTKRSYTLEGILYRGEFSYPNNHSRSAKLKRYLFRRVLAKGMYDRLHLDDEFLHEFATSIKPNRQTQLELAVNPVEFFEIDRAQARQRLGLPAEGRIVSLSGVIDNRKGADLLVRAFISALEQGLEDTSLLLAGPHYDDIKAVIQQPEIQRYFDSGQIISLDRLLDEQDMFSAAAAGDLVAAPYPNHSGRSSIILWAAAAGTPVLATDRGCIGHVVETESLGKICDVADLEGFTKTLLASLDEPWSDADRERVIGYAQRHSVENYRTLNAKLILSQLDAS
ncbi:glycosyltransferase [Algisphaera agarilytica]|uniref:Glycosyltransferase involved in cell wall biosynthesis n=1 Tax=Algisphaera agarilytica TaxID=1385975 RepID=A0A7X0LL98_9BACT|nr:glycosyltransferase [Algisphaera agarilytica]MBB6430787.1 glycosyltransferase involved in cell wall biosynthesis [Algisphaera agarilytica]